MRRNYTIGERAIILVGRMAGKSLEEVNAALAADDSLSEGSSHGPVPQGSWDYQDAYAKSIGAPDVDRSVWEGVWDHVTHPKPVGRLF